MWHFWVWCCLRSSDWMQRKTDNSDFNLNFKNFSFFLFHQNLFFFKQNLRFDQRRMAFSDVILIRNVNILETWMFSRIARWFIELCPWIMQLGERQGAHFMNPFRWIGLWSVSRQLIGWYTMYDSTFFVHTVWSMLDDILCMIPCFSYTLYEACTLHSWCFFHPHFLRILCI